MNLKTALNHLRTILANRTNTFKNSALRELENFDANGCTCHECVDPKQPSQFCIFLSFCRDYGRTKHDYETVKNGELPEIEWLVDRYLITEPWNPVWTFLKKVFVEKRLKPILSTETDSETK